MGERMGKERERVWGESGMREVQDRRGKAESEDGFQVRRGNRKCRQSGTRMEARERQKTEGGERQKRRGSRKRDEESGMRDKDKRKRNELDEVER